MARKGLGFGVVLAVLVAGCSGSPRMPVKAASSDAAALGSESFDELVAQARATETQAHIPDQLYKAVDLYERANRVRPGQREILNRLSMLHYAWSYCLYDEVASEEKQIELYELGKNYAYEALMQIDAFREAMERGESIDEETVMLIPEENSEEMILLAVNWARWGELKGIMSQAFDIPKVKALADRAVELDPDYNYGAPHRLLGSYFTVLPGMFGGDAEVGGDHFRWTIEHHPGYLENHYMYAAYYAKHLTVEDEELFVRELRFVLDYEIDPDHPERVCQEAAKRMARELLDQREDIFF